MLEYQKSAPAPTDCCADAIAGAQGQLEYRKRSVNERYTFW